MTDPETPPLGAPPKRPTALGTVLTPSQTIRLGKWGVTRRKSLQKAWEGKCSPRHAIKMQCLDCCGEDEEAIRTCGDRCCPLWHFRPWKDKPQKTSN